MYKDKSFVESINTKVKTEKKNEYIKFEETSKKEIQSRDRKNPINEVSQEELHTPIAEVRRSLRTPKLI